MLFVINCFSTLLLLFNIMIWINNTKIKRLTKPKYLITYMNILLLIFYNKYFNFQPVFNHNKQQNQWYIKKLLNYLFFFTLVTNPEKLPKSIILITNQAKTHPKQSQQNYSIKKPISHPTSPTISNSTHIHHLSISIQYPFKTCILYQIYSIPS